MTIRVEAPNQQRLVVLVESELVIGRECEGLRLADPQVSRRHLLLRRVGASVEISDLDSTNGSLLDGVPLAEPQLVDRPCVALIGDTTVTIDPACVEETSPIGTATTVRQIDDLRATSIDVAAERLSLGATDVEADSLEGDTITIVFCDIESSTERATAMGSSSTTRSSEMS